MSEDKRKRYLKISEQIAEYMGGEANILGVAHCATRLRIVVEDQSKVHMEKIEAVDLVKGAFVTGDQTQIIFGAGLVNEVYEVFAAYTHKENMSLQDVKSQAAEKQNPFQKIIKSLSDVFIDIMPAILAAALLMGLAGLLGQRGLFGEQSVVEMVPTLAGLNQFISIVSSSVFSVLPLIVVYSSTKRYGGRPILGLVIGVLMLSNSLADAYQAAQGTVEVEVISLLGLKIQLIGFQGGIIIALMMGFVVAKLDKFFEKKIPNAVKLLLSPLFTVFVSAFLLFTIVGPVGRMLSGGLTTGCIASAIASSYVYFTGLTVLGYGTTVLPGFAIVAPENNGYANYLIAHLIALLGGIILTVILGKGLFRKKN